LAISHLLLPEKASKVEWVSVGYPTLLVTSEIGNPSNVNLFHFDDEGFYTYVQMLTVGVTFMIKKTVSTQRLKTRWK